MGRIFGKLDVFAEYLAGYTVKVLFQPSAEYLMCTSKILNTKFKVLKIIKKYLSIFFKNKSVAYFIYCRSISMY